MRTGVWNHNIHYHSLVLGLVPSNCDLALDVGCGQGLLARRLATRCRHVIGIDADRATLLRAANAKPTEDHLTFVHGDVLAYPFTSGSIDLITVVAAIHHLPLKPALRRLRDLLKPGGILIVVGLYRNRSLVDHAWACAALPSSWILRLRNGHMDVGAPVHEPQETLSEIEGASAALLPGAIIQRRLLFRYSLVWRKPQ
ncbi:MAG: class I SAM-dependent methyltransferase [Acidobacteriota bacterium]